MINILIADDHEIFTEALVMLLSDSDDVRVIGTAPEGGLALQLLDRHPEAHVVVLDVSMPSMDGVEVLRELRRRRSTIPVLMLTQELSPGVIVRALRAGAAGYVLKTAGREEFLRAIRDVAEGRQYISPAAKDLLLASITGRDSHTGPPRLTRRERDVLKLIVAGRTTNHIAAELFISSNTVETHRRNLLQKLGLPNAAALVRYAVEHGLVDE
jgi:two-component system nitrate/nitrite response regulator NarL